MGEISRAALFGKLNSVAYKAIEAATVFCKLRGNPYVELAHWFHQLLQLQDSDLHRIIRQFNIEPARLARVTDIDFMHKQHVTDKKVDCMHCHLQIEHGRLSQAPAAAHAAAAAYSPAKYGILTELLPPKQLVVANGWIEGLTVGSIILGILLGGGVLLTYADDCFEWRRFLWGGRASSMILRARRVRMVTSSRCRIRVALTPSSSSSTLSSQASAVTGRSRRMAAMTGSGA